MCKLQKWKIDEINTAFNNNIEMIDVAVDAWYEEAVKNDIMETPTLLFIEWTEKFKMSHNINVDLAKQIISWWIKSMNAEVVE